MAHQETQDNALLVWINSLHLEEPIDHIFQLQDGTLLVKLIHKLKGQESQVDVTLELPVEGRFEFISDFLKRDCRYNANEGAIVSWENIICRVNLEVELSKVVVLLLYHSVMNGLVGPNNLNYNTELGLASVLRFVLDNEDSLYLSENLEKFLNGQPLFDLSSVSSTSSYSDDESPVFFRRRRREVKFLELKTVASSSVGSPIQNVVNTPQFQMRKMQKMLAQERDMRDEIERELANSNQIITERESQISQLQQRVQKLKRDNEQSQLPKEIEELQSKNEGLLKRLHEVLKQCQDLKTNKSQMERKIDDLTEENGRLGAEMRAVLSRLSSAQEALHKLSQDQESLQMEWERRKAHLERELNQALSQKELLSEKIQILQGKISILEEDLSKANSENQDGGEVMGPVMEWERLNQEIAALTLKLTQQQEKIIQLEKEKAEMDILHNQEKSKFEQENSCLQELVSKLNQTLTDKLNEKEELEQTSKKQQAELTAQIEALSADIACLTETIQHREMMMTTLKQQVDEERRKAELLTEDMEKRRQLAQETIQELHHQVNHLGNALKAEEEEALSNAEKWDRERFEITRQNEAVSRERDAVSAEYLHFRQENESMVDKLKQQVLLLENQQKAEQCLLSQLKLEKDGLEEKVLSLEVSIGELRVKCQDMELESEANRISHLETVNSVTGKLQEAEETLEEYKAKLANHYSILEEHAALQNQLSSAEESAKELRAELEEEKEKHQDTLKGKLEKDSQMTAEILELGNKTLKMSEELELLRQELNKVKQEKCYAESCLAKMVIENKDMSSSRDQAFLLIKEKEVIISKLTSESESLCLKLNLAEQAKVDQMKKLADEKEIISLELCALKRDREDMELKLQSTIDKHLEELLSFQAVKTDLEGFVNMKQSEIEVLQAKLSLKEEELKKSVLNLQCKVSQTEDLQKLLLEEENKSLQCKKELDTREDEVQLLKATIGKRDDEIISLQKIIQTELYNATSAENLYLSKTEKQQSCISALELQLSDFKKCLAEKDYAVEQQATDVLNLKQELAVAQEKASSLEECLKISESALKDRKIQEEVLKKETLSSQEVMEKLKAELKEIRREDEKRIQALKISEAQCKDLEEQIVQLQTQIRKICSIASERESELVLVRNELNERNMRIKQLEAVEPRYKVLQEKCVDLQVQMESASTTASNHESEIDLLKNELKKKNVRVVELEAKEAQCKVLEERILQLQTELKHTSTLASDKANELNLLRNELQVQAVRVKELETGEAQRKTLQERIILLESQIQSISSNASQRECELTLRVQELEAEEHQRRILEERVVQLQAQVDTLVSEKVSQLMSLNNEIKDKENTRAKEQEMEKARCVQLEEKVALLEVEVKTVSALASQKESELKALHNEVKERDNLRARASEVEEVQLKELKVKVYELEAQLLEASALASTRQSTLDSLLKELNEKKIKNDAQCMELECTIARLNMELEAANSLTAQSEEMNEKLKENIQKLEVICQESKEKDSLRVFAIAAEESIKKEMEDNIAKLKAEILLMSVEREQVEEKHQQQLGALRHEKEMLVSVKETLQKEQERSQHAGVTLENKLELAKREISTLLALKDAVSERERRYNELKEQLTAKTEALEHYKLQVEIAKNHYNNKKELLLNATKKSQAYEKSLEGSKQEVTALKGQVKMLQLELEQVKTSEKNLALKVKSLQAQVDYADRQLREQKHQAREELLKSDESVSLQIFEKPEDTSKDSLDCSLDDSLNTTRKPLAIRESSTLKARSSERLKAKRMESLETLYFTPLGKRKLESSITSLDELTLDSTKKLHCGHRRIKQRTPGRGELDGELDSFYSLQSAESISSLASQKGRPILMDITDNSCNGDQLMGLPGYRRSGIHYTAPTYATSTFNINAENEPEFTDDWVRIAELQSRNKACLPHLKSSYPLESRPSLCNPSFTITDDELRMGDPSETIRRASMLPSQTRASMLPGQIKTRAASQKASLLAKPNANTGVLRRAGNERKGSDTPEAKRVMSCFPRPMTPKDHNDKRFADHKSDHQNRPANTPSTRRMSTMFTIENTPMKNGKGNILHRSINKMRSSTRKSPGPVSKMSRMGKSPEAESARPQRRSPCISSSKATKITSSARKLMSYKARMKI